MSRLAWGLAIWLPAFLGLELPAHFGLVPWPTLSSTVWDGIRDWHPVAYFVAIAMVVLFGHFEFRWSVGWLIAVAAALTVAVVVHLIAR